MKLLKITSETLLGTGNRLQHIEAHFFLALEVVGVYLCVSVGGEVCKATEARQ